ncbi:VOC family protein [Rhizobium alvei]|uniref:VOC family protein n=1 Tax=Rhizobium alvei TaxID=1132659 RepID=A0ABT8YTQ9_9HYPH|nr:VOC family protein [Rhizobium alvei]MDO6966729.1 VOC family protein [Rhizobium alvei]
MTIFPVTALRSVELSTPSLDHSIAFYTGVWGLDLVAREGDKAWLAATGSDFHVLELKAGEGSDLRKVSFHTSSEDELERLAGVFSAQGATFVRPLEAAPGPAGGRHFAVREPQGCCLEFVHGDATKPARNVADRPVRLAHVNINSVDVDALAGFYEQALGFALTDRSKAMAFLRCNSDHHAVVIADAPTNGLNHIAFLMPDLESVMRGAGNVKDAGYPIGWGVGRHGPGDNVFAYFVDPMGVVVEYTAEVLQVDDHYRVGCPDDWIWPPGRSDQWGIAPPKSEECKKAQISVPFASP